MVRLDRVLDAQQKNQPLVSAGTTIEVDAEALTRYSASLAARPSATLPS
jgi:hypothetical protein